MHTAAAPSTARLAAIRLPAGALSHHPLRPPPQVRPVQPGDAPRLAHYVEHLSPRSQQLRFHGVVRGCTPGLLALLAGTDGQHQRVLVASLQVDGGECLVGEARYVVDASGTVAEFALSVADAWQGTGVATRLMARLLQQADDDGLHWLHGEVLGDNGRMLAFMQRMGFTLDDGAWERDDAAASHVVRVERCVQSRSRAVGGQPAGAAGQPARYGALWAWSHWLNAAKARRWVGA